jgi:hypothetical protein
MNFNYSYLAIILLIILIIVIAFLLKKKEGFKTTLSQAVTLTEVLPPPDTDCESLTNLNCYINPDCIVNNDQCVKPCSEETECSFTDNGYEMCVETDDGCNKKCSEYGPDHCPLNRCKFEYDSCLGFDEDPPCDAFNIDIDNCPESRCDKDESNGNCDDKLIQHIESDCYAKNPNANDCKGNCKVKSIKDLYGSEIDSYCVPNIECGPGEQINISNDDQGNYSFNCEQCPAGTFEENNICKLCPKDHFSENPGATRCVTKQTCADDEYIESDNLKQGSYKYDLISNYFYDKYNTKDNRTCKKLNKCTNNQMLIEKQDYIPPDDTLKIDTAYKDIFNRKYYYKSLECENLSKDECEMHDACEYDDDGKTCKNKNNPIMFSDYQCNNLKTCSENAFISNYQDQIDTKQDGMFTKDRDCSPFTDCKPGTHIEYNESIDFPTITRSDGSKMYTTDRTCATCGDYEFTDDVNMEKCETQPVFGLGEGTDCPKDKNWERCTSYECDDGSYQDMTSHRDLCKPQQVCKGIKNISIFDDECLSKEYHENDMIKYCKVNDCKSIKGLVQDDLSK